MTWASLPQRVMLATRSHRENVVGRIRADGPVSSRHSLPNARVDLADELQSVRTISRWHTSGCDSEENGVSLHRRPTT